MIFKHTSLLIFKYELSDYTQKIDWTPRKRKPRENLEGKSVEGSEEIANESGNDDNLNAETTDNTNELHDIDPEKQEDGEPSNPDKNPIEAIIEVDPSILPDEMEALVESFDKVQKG